MSSNLFILFAIVIIHLIVGGVILINIGKKKNKKGLLIAGWAMEAHAPILLFIVCLINSSFSSTVLFMFIFFLPIAVVIGAIVALTKAIILIVEGFTNHQSKKIAVGFILFFGTITVVATPIVLISIFGLPIAMM